jgi:hypothetical protein
VVTETHPAMASMEQAARKAFMVLMVFMAVTPLVWLRAAA